MVPVLGTGLLKHLEFPEGTEVRGATFALLGKPLSTILQVYVNGRCLEDGGW